MQQEVAGGDHDALTRFCLDVVDTLVVVVIIRRIVRREKNSIQSNCYGSAFSWPGEGKQGEVRGNSKMGWSEAEPYKKIVIWLWSEVDTLLIGVK